MVLNMSGEESSGKGRPLGDARMGQGLLPGMRAACPWCVGGSVPTVECARGAATDGANPNNHNRRTVPNNHNRRTVPGSPEVLMTDQPAEIEEKSSDDLASRGPLPLCKRLGLGLGLGRGLGRRLRHR